MLTEFMSMEHTRATLTSMRPKVGDGLYTNRRRKILTMAEDTSRGDHDTLMSARSGRRDTPSSSVLVIAVSTVSAIIRIKNPDKIRAQEDGIRFGDTCPSNPFKPAANSADLL